MISKIHFVQLIIFLNLVLAGLRLGLKNYQVGEKWIPDDYLYLCKNLYLNINSNNICSVVVICNLILIGYNLKHRL